MSHQTGTLPRQGTQTSSSHQLQVSGVMQILLLVLKLKYFSLWPQFWVTKYLPDFLAFCEHSEASEPSWEVQSRPGNGVTLNSPKPCKIFCQVLRCSSGRESHRLLEWLGFGRDLKDHLLPTHLPWTGTHCTRPHCSKQSCYRFSCCLDTQLSLNFHFFNFSPFNLDITWSDVASEWENLNFLPE